MSDNHARIAALPIWSGAVRIEPLSGGISNLSYTVADSTGKYVVRLTRDFPFHHVFRDREVMSARAAHAAGFAPEIVHAAPGLMVSRFIEGRVLTSADLRADIPRIAEFLRRFHIEMPARVSGAGYIFWVFHTNRDYVRMLSAEGRASDADRWLAINTELEDAQIPLPIRFGHHDLLPANLIDDGRRLWLIDYEYAGFDTAMFDLANLSSNNGFSRDESESLLAEYFGAPPARDLVRAHAAMEAASLLREALWSLVSVTQLDAPGVDYQAYADENFAKLDAALAAYRGRFGS
jgi:thiamine kinase-like enzyme